MFTDTPWLAAGPALAPWPQRRTWSVPDRRLRTLPDRRPLSAGLETFLDAGAPPVYFGFGSIRAPEDPGKTMIATARALGRRVNTEARLTGARGQQWLGEIAAVEESLRHIRNTVTQLRTRVPNIPA
jgi:hypothetical protein